MKETSTVRTVRPLLISIFLIAISGVIAVAQDQMRWSSRAPLLEPRQEIYTDVANGQIYVVGGIGADGQTLASMERYDAQVDKWVRLDPLPLPRHHVAVASRANKIFAIGGFHGAWPRWRAQSNVDIYNIKTGHWTKGPSLPEPRGEHVAVVAKDRIFVIGGRVKKDPQAKTFFEHIDTDLNTCLDEARKYWTTCAPMPTARNSHAAAVIDGKIYVVGGRRNNFGASGGVTIENLAALEVYNPQTNAWTMRAPMPIAQGGLAAVGYAGKLYVFGGEEFSPTQKVFPNVWVYDPEIDKWSSLPDMPTPRHGLAAASIDGKIFVFGGANRVGFGAVSTTEALTAE